MSVGSGDTMKLDLHLLLDGSADGLVVYDRLWKFVYINRAAEKYLGRPRESLVGKVVWDEYPSTAQDSSPERALRAAAESNQVHEYEQWSPLQKSWTWVRVVPSGEMLLVYFRDATVRHEAKRALDASEARFRALFEHGSEGVMLTAPSGKIFAVNPAACQLLGRTEAEITELGRTGIIDPTDTRLAGLLEERRRNGRAVGELRMLRKDGSTVPVELSSAVFQMDGAEFTSMRLRDLTAQKQLQDQVTFSAQMASVGTLAAGVAHEINNPLTFVTSNLGFLREELTELAPLLPAKRAPEILNVIGEMEVGAERVRRIVLDLKTFAHAGEVDDSPIHILPALESALSMVDSDLRQRALVIKCFAPAPPVRASRAKLSQVFLNLLLNAARAIPMGAPTRNEVRVSVATNAAGEAQIEIADTGTGIAAADLPRIFDPFFTTKPIGQGTGLGLSVCLGIITAFGGRIEVESVQGKGSLFRLLLPAASSTVSAAKSS